MAGTEQATSAVSAPNLIQGGTEGHTALFEQDGIFTVVNSQGNVQFAGGEVSAEFAFWRTEFGVPADDGGVTSE